MLIIRRSKLHYTASGIITLKQVSGLKLLKYNSINMSKHEINKLLHLVGYLSPYYMMHGSLNIKVHTLYCVHVVYVVIILAV